jgi:hypothetical protein
VDLCLRHYNRHFGTTPFGLASGYRSPGLKITPSEVDMALRVDAVAVELRNALLNDKLAATGMRAGENYRMRIPFDDWAELWLFSATHSHDVRGSQRLSDFMHLANMTGIDPVAMYGYVYGNLLLPRETVQKMWPAGKRQSCMRGGPRHAGRNHEGKSYQSHSKRKIADRKVLAGFKEQLRFSLQGNS